MRHLKNVKLTTVFVFVVALFLTCSTVYAQSKSTEPIKLGVISAWDFAGGQGIKRGAEMAIRDINKSGGLLGRKLEGIFYDNKGNADEAKKATERVLYKDKVDAVTGFWRSDLAIVVQPLIMEANKIMMIGGSSSPILTTDRIGKSYEQYKNTFAIEVSTLSLFVCHEQGIPQMLPAGLDKIAVMVEKAAWCDPLFDDVMNKYKKNIVYSTRFSTTVTDFQIEFAKAKAAGANHLYFVATGASGTPSVKQWYDMQLPMIYTGYNVEAQALAFYQNTEGKAEGVVTSVVGGTAGLPITAKSRPWYESYIKTFNEKPAAYTSGFEYDAVMVWAEAVKIAGTTDTDAVRKVLEGKNFKYTGVCGQINGFDKIHNPIGDVWKEGDPWGYVVIQWHNGQQQLVWPQGLKAAKAKPIFIPKRVQDLMKKK